MLSNNGSLVKFRSSGVIALGLGVDEDAHHNNQFDWVGLGRASASIFHLYIFPLIFSPSLPPLSLSILLGGWLTSGSNQSILLKNSPIQFQTT